MLPLVQQQHGTSCRNSGSPALDQANDIKDGAAAADHTSSAQQHEIHYQGLMDYSAYSATASSNNSLQQFPSQVSTKYLSDDSDDERSWHGDDDARASTTSAAVPSSATSPTVKTAVHAFDTFLQRTGGHDGGWHPDDHLQVVCTSS